MIRFDLITNFLGKGSKEKYFAFFPFVGSPLPPIKLGSCKSMTIAKIGRTRLAVDMDKPRTETDIL